MADNDPPRGGGVKLPVVGQTSRRTLIIGGATVAVIVGVAYLYRARRRSSGTVVAADPATGTATGGAYVNPAPSRTLDPTQGEEGLITTDDEWVNAVAPMLISADWDAQFVYLTLGKYLAGEELSSDEAALVRAAWGMKGKPPSGRGIVLANSGGGSPGNNPPPPPPPADNPPPPPPPPAETIYTFKSGDTLGRVAALYGMTARQLYDFGTNAASLEQYAQWHGKSSFWPEAIVYPGYNIGVPVK